MYERGTKGKIKCPICNKKGKTSFLVQVPFIAICEKGHLNDFPWDEWVHRSSNPECNGKEENKLRLISTGSATLGGQKVKCLECNSERSLAGITSASGNTTTLSKTLMSDGEFTCPGERPWLGASGKEECSAPVKGSLKSALNVYFGHVRSSIYIPRTDNSNIESLLNILEDPPLSTLLKTLIALKAEKDMIVENLRSQQGTLLRDYSDEEIIEAIVILEVDLPDDEVTSSQNNDEEYDPVRIRKEEFDVLRKPKSEDLLKIKQTNISDYHSDEGKYFSKIMLIDKLRETRALAGFSRIYAENEQSPYQRKAMLWNDKDKANFWLPAYVVYGEGIFFEFRKDIIESWEEQNEVKDRVSLLIDRYIISQKRRKLETRNIEARYIMIHTFSHILMNRLTFECGYSSAALRERLYVSSDNENSMAGLLIYTADGDAEGTMGGLVRMGKAGNLEPIIRSAIEAARWCSSDPVCMEMGKMHGQGPDSCNLAACHNCALVPETACEDFNRFLDRGLLIGEIDNPSIGFFNL
jgi:hypothetical protein